MKFIYEKQEEKKTLTLNDVEDNQFFVCADGYLCQKIGSESYITIADEEGCPCSGYYRNNTDTPIARLLPIVRKIEF